MAGEAWKVCFSSGLFDEENETMAGILREATGCERPRIQVVADSNLVQHTPGIGSAMGRWISAHGIEMAGTPAVAGGGEKIKCDSMQTALRIMEAVVDSGIGRADAILAIGGGALLDVAGFAAANVRGGIRIVRVPTTPAAMADGAFAGVASLDTQMEKDAISVKSEPSAIVVDPSFSSTVLDGVWRGGLGEIIRCALATDSALFGKFAESADYLRCRDIDVLGQILKECAKTRASRSPGDFGLWSAFRLEALSGYKLPHGYAVPMGVCIDLGYAVEKGMMKQETRDMVKNLLADCGALDGVPHSHHLLSQPELVVDGLDEWARRTGRDAVTIVSGPGAVEIEEKPDREAYIKVVKDFLSEAIGV